jgi:hypothetical protein
MKRTRPESGDDLVRLDSLSSTVGNETETVAAPLVPVLKAELHAPPEPISAYMKRVKAAAQSKQCSAEFAVKQAIDEDGLYVHKRPIRGLGNGSPLATGGSLFHHTLLYYKVDGKVRGMGSLPQALLAISCSAILTVETGSIFRKLS